MSPSMPLNGCEINVSVNSKPDHLPPRATAGDSHILVAPGVGFSLLSMPVGLPGVCSGGLKSK